MKGLACFVALLTLLFSQAVPASMPVITLNTTGQPPLNTADGKGFMDEVAIEAFRRIGYALQTVSLPAERGLKSANSGIVDGEMSRIAGLNKYYPHLLRVPEKIMDWEFVAFSYYMAPSSQGWTDLANKSIAHINGWKILEKSIPPSAEVTKTANASQLFNLLQRKRADCILYERWGGQYLLREMAMQDVKMKTPALTVKEMFIYLHNKHVDLVPKLAIALRSMKQDGSYQKLVDKHLVPMN